MLEQAAEGIGATVDRLDASPAARFDDRLIATVTEATAELGYPHRPMISGATHDAHRIAGFCPTAMIFVPSRGGISHHPDEYTAPHQLEAAANVLLASLLKSAG